jgi:hypothetical protein
VHVSGESHVLAAAAELAKFMRVAGEGRAIGHCLCDSEPTGRAHAYGGPAARDAGIASTHDRNESDMKKPLVPLICCAIALAFVLGACGSGSSDSTAGGSSQTFSPKEGNGADDSPSQGEPSFEDGVYTDEDMKVEITDYKVIKPGEKGNEYGKKPVIAFWYKTTNLSGKKVDPTTAFLFTFNAYQDNNPNRENELDVAALPDDKYLDSQTENIKKGGTVPNAVGYELDDLVTPVDLVAGGLFGDEPVGKATYKLS